MKTKCTFLLLLLLMEFSSCDLLNKKDEKTSFVANISAGTDYDFLAYSADDNSYIAVRQNNGIPVSALVKPSGSADPYPVWFNSEGNIERIVINGYILLFSNYTTDKFDIAIIGPDGEISVVRELTIPEQYRVSLQLKSLSLGQSLIWAGHSIGAVSCALSIFGGAAATAATMGIGIPAATVIIGLGCGATAIGIATTIIGNEKIADFLNLPLKTVKSFTTVVNCVLGTPLSCFMSAAGLTLSVAGGEMVAHDKEIKLAQGVLLGGTGDIQVTLTWDSSADIDLYVQDPSGEWIWFGHQNSASGGWLDVDDTDGFGPENIKWDKNMAPSGTYKVYVKHYAGASANYSIMVQAFGRKKQYSGNVGPGQAFYITDFSKTYLKSAEKKVLNETLPMTVK